MKRNIIIFEGNEADERDQFVAVKPVCEILGVNYTTQVEKLKEHPIFSSTIPLRGTVGAELFYQETMQDL